MENNDTSYPSDGCPTGNLTGSNRPWRGQKGDVYEGGTRVATIVSWPGAKAGRVETPVQIIDWMPTFSALAGYRPARDLKWDGVDLSAVLTRHEPLPERSLYTVGPNRRARALRAGPWKLVVSGTVAKQKNELYHLGQDPGEAQDLAAREPAKLKEMLARLEMVAARDLDAVAKD